MALVSHLTLAKTSSKRVIITEGLSFKKKLYLLLWQLFLNQQIELFLLLLLFHQPLEKPS